MDSDEVVLASNRMLSGSLPLENLESIAWGRDGWNTLLSLLPPQPGSDKRRKIDGYMDGWNYTYITQHQKKI